MRKIKKMGMWLLVIGVVAGAWFFGATDKGQEMLTKWGIKKN